MSGSLNYPVQGLTLPVSGGTNKAVWSLTIAADRNLVVAGFELYARTQLNSTLDDALKLEMVIGHATAGAGGTTITPVKLEESAASTHITRAESGGAPATGGTKILVFPYSWNWRIPFDKVWIPEVTPEFRSPTIFEIRLVGDPPVELEIDGNLMVQAR